MKIANEAALSRKFKKFNESKAATALHMPYLREMARKSENVVELGIKKGTSSIALAWCQGELFSYDIAILPYVKSLMPIIGDKWHVTQADTRKVPLEEIPEHDLLFVDTLHRYHQVVAELDTFARKTKKWIVFHDTITFATWGADGEKGTWVDGPRVTPGFEPTTHGIRLAIDEFMIENPEWVIVRHAPYSHGLLTLEKIA